jgi:transcriptional regulator with XRE-family HTH domain
MSVFGDFVRLRREELSLDQAGLAQKLGVQQQTVSKWEQAKVIPGPQRIRQLADALRVDVSDLMRHAGYLPDAAPLGVQGEERFHQLLGEVAHLTNDQLILLIDHAWEEHRDRAGFGLEQPRRRRGKKGGG